MDHLNALKIGFMNPNFGLLFKIVPDLISGAKDDDALQPFSIKSTIFPGFLTKILILID